MQPRAGIRRPTLPCSQRGHPLSQTYLPLVAKDRSQGTAVDGVELRAATWPWSGGRAEEFDAIVFGTGFDPAASVSVTVSGAVIDLDAVRLDADRYTFHPDLQTGVRRHVGPVGWVLRFHGATGEEDCVRLGWGHPMAGRPTSARPSPPIARGRGCRRRPE